MPPKTSARPPAPKGGARRTRVGDQDSEIAAVFDAPTSVLKVPAATPSRPRGGLMRATTPHPNVIGLVQASYKLEGWETLIATATAPMDLICVRNTKMHFVKVLGGAEPSDGERNQFIQNAMSNSADPIFASLEGEKLVTKNINEGTRISIKARQPRGTPQ